MKFDVLKKEAKLGTIVFQNGIYRFDGDDATKLFIANSIRTGIEIKKDICIDGIFSITKKPIDASDPLFAFALIDFLRDSGYTLYETVESIETLFDKILAGLADKPDICVQLTARWAKMSPLEKSYLIECLEKDLAE